MGKRSLKKEILQKADQEFVKQQTETLTKTLELQIETSDRLSKHYSKTMELILNDLTSKKKELEKTNDELKEVRALAEAIKPDYHQTQKEMAELRGRLNTTLYFFGAILFTVVGAVIAAASGVLEGLWGAP